MTFYETIIAYGFRPRRPVAPDGKWHRCPTDSHPRKKNGSYKLARDGQVGWFKEFGRDMSPNTWRTDRVERSEPYDSSWLLKAQADAAAHKTARTQAARNYYDNCTPLVGGHPYLESHGLDMTGAYGLRVDASGWLVVPASRRSTLTSVQKISPTGQKRFWSGASVKGSSFTIDRRNATVTVLCEGLATGLAIFAAVPDARVVVAFDAGNLTQMEKPTGFAVIAADNDWETVCQRHRDEGLALPFDPWEERPEWCLCNPGRCAAAAAAKKFGCGVVWPNGIEGTDWCDWRQEIYQARLMERRPKEREADIRRAVDTKLAMQIRRNSTFIMDAR